MDIATFLLCMAGILACMYGMYREGMRHGHYAGASDGYLMAIRDLCDGHMKVDGRKLLFDKTASHFVDKTSGEFMTELDMDKMEFEEL